MQSMGALEEERLVLEMIYKFEEVISYIVEADSLDGAEAVMGEEYSSDFEVHRELNYVGKEG